MHFGYIYKIKFPNGKHYIGLTTTSLEQRKIQHKQTAKRCDTKCLYNALRKYNMVDTLELIEIDTADTEEELCEKEIEYIIKYNSYYMNGNGYNMTFGGEGTNGYVYTEEDRQKMSEMCKKYWETPEAITKCRESQKKRFENPEAGKEHSEKMKKYYEDHPEAGKEHSEKIKKYHQDHPEAGKEHGEKMKKYFENPEAIQKNMEALKKYYRENPEAGKERGEKIKKYHQDHPEAGKKYGEKIKKYWENPKARQKMREIKKKYFEENPEEIRKRLDTMGKNKPFDVFTKDGIFIKTFNYQFEAKEYLQTEYKITSIISICSVLAGNIKSSAGFVFKYK